MKHWLLGVMFMGCSGVNAQINLKPPGPGLQACELICSCPAVPGQVNKCVHYWTIKLNNYGNVTREVNKDPAACSAAVASNSSSLFKHFGLAPEVSLPTKEMAEKATGLSPPAEASLPFSRKLDSAPAVAPGDGLDQQISSEVARILALTEDVSSYNSVNASIGPWGTATAAGKRLVARMDSVDKSLLLSKPWPTVQEFAPKIWDLQICNHSKASEVAELGKRIESGNDTAWGFAFWSDWVMLQEAFSPTSKPVFGPPTPGFESLGAPFFVESDAVVRERTQKSLFTLLDVRAFRGAVSEVGAKVETFAQKLNGQVNSRRNELDIAVKAESDVEVLIRGLFHKRQEEVAIMKAGVESVSAEKLAAQTSITKTRAEIAAAASSLQNKTTRRNQLRASRTAAATDLGSKRKKVDEAQQKLESVVLNCGGQSYEACTNASAKKDFDRRRYEANQAIAVARATHAKAQDAMLKIDADLLAAEKAVLDLRTSVATLNRNLGVAQTSFDDLDKNVTRLNAELQVQQAALLTSTALMVTLNGALEGLRKARMQ